MLLDDRIHKHLDALDGIEELISKHIDSIYKSIDVDALMKEPENYLLDTVDQLMKILIDEVVSDAAAEGIKFAMEVKKAKNDLVIADTDQPKLNAEIANV